MQYADDVVWDSCTSVVDMGVSVVSFVGPTVVNAEDGVVIGTSAVSKKYNN